MKNIKLIAGIFLCLIVTSVSFLSCGKKNVHNDHPTYVNVNFKEMKIGENHNRYLINAFEKIKKSINKNGTYRLSGNEQDEYRKMLIADFETIDYDPTSIGFPTYQSFLLDAVAWADTLRLYEYDINELSTNYLTQSAEVFVNEILSEIDHASTLQEMQQKLQGIEARANVSLHNIDLDIVMGTLEITKSSAYLWAPESEGGYDLYTRTFGVAPVSISNGRVVESGCCWWKRAIKGDAVASASYFLRLGGGLAFGAVPGTNVAILGG
jgi:hypothetical protein